MELEAQTGSQPDKTKRRSRGPAAPDHTGGNKDPKIDFSRAEESLRKINVLDATLNSKSSTEIRQIGQGFMKNSQRLMFNHTVNEGLSPVEAKFHNDRLQQMIKTVLTKTDSVFQVEFIVNSEDLRMRVRYLGQMKQIPGTSVSQFEPIESHLQGTMTYPEFYEIWRKCLVSKTSVKKPVDETKKRSPILKGHDQANRDPEEVKGTKVATTAQKVRRQKRQTAKNAMTALSQKAVDDKSSFFPAMANYLKGQWVGPGCFDLATTTDEDWQDLVNLSDKSSLLSDQLQQIREDFASEFTGDCKSADCKLYNKGLFTCLPRNSTKHHILGRDQMIYRVKPDEKFNYKLAETIPPPETEQDYPKLLTCYQNWLIQTTSWFTDMSKMSHTGGVALKRFKCLVERYLENKCSDGTDDGLPDWKLLTQDIPEEKRTLDPANWAKQGTKIPMPEVWRKEILDLYIFTLFRDSGIGYVVPLSRWKETLLQISHPDLHRWGLYKSQPEWKAVFENYKFSSFMPTFEVPLIQGSGLVVHPIWSLLVQQTKGDPNAGCLLNEMKTFLASEVDTPGPWFAMNQSGPKKTDQIDADPYQRKCIVPQPVTVPEIQANVDAEADQVAEQANPLSQNPAALDVGDLTDQLD